MKLIIYSVFLVFFFLISCKKENTEINRLGYGTYYGQRLTFSYTGAWLKKDTITLTFDTLKYNYNGNNSLDFGSGIYTINNDSILFIDQVARNTLYSWDWILNDKFEFSFTTDSIFLTRQNLSGEIDYKLKRIK
jgi:hypothetical protein